MKWTIIFLIAFCNNLFSCVAQKYEVKPDVWGKMIQVSFLFNKCLDRLHNKENVSFEQVFQEMENIKDCLESQEDKNAYELLIKSRKEKYEEELKNFLNR